MQDLHCLATFTVKDMTGPVVLVTPRKYLTH